MRPAGSGGRRRSSQAVLPPLHAHRPPRHRNMRSWTSRGRPGVDRRAPAPLFHLDLLIGEAVGLWRSPRPAPRRRRERATAAHGPACRSHQVLTLTADARLDAAVWIELCAVTPTRGVSADCPRGSARLGRHCPATTRRRRSHWRVRPGAPGPRVCTTMVAIADGVFLTAAMATGALGPPDRAHCSRQSRY